MITKKSLVSAVVAVGIATGGILVASPAHASQTWGNTWPSETKCQEGANRKLHYYNKRGYRVKVDERCTYHKIGENPSYWYSQLTYTPRY